MNGFPGGSVIGDINVELEAFRKSDERRDLFVQDLVKRYNDLQSSHRSLVHDFENEKQSRRAWQERFEVVQTASARLQHNVNNNCFALALIDGDGAIFQDALLQSANEGGSDAAHKLHTEIKNHLQSIYPESSQWAVLVHIYVNLDGLAKKLYSCGLIKSGTDLQAFARAFSLNQPLFNIVDVGSGKERADHKLKEMLRLFVANQQCKHIILGGISHDNGYLPGLDQWRYDQAMYTRITLLETVPSTPGFLALNFRTMRCPSVFRSEHLPAKPSNVVVPNYVPAATPQRQAPLMMPTPVSATTPPIMHAPTAAAPKTRTPVSASVPGHSSVMSGVPFGPPAVEAAPILHMHMAENGRAKSVSAQSNGTATPAPSATTSSPEATSWAQVGNKGKPNGQNYSIAPAPKKERPYILLNAFDQRLDIPVSKAKSNFEGLDARVKRSGKVCNVFHINGKCYDPYCEYDHDPRLGEAERTALRIKARQRSCALMLNCMDPYCINGHQCVYGPNCAYGDDCFFAETHHMDRKPVMRRFENDEIQLLQT